MENTLPTQDQPFDLPADMGVATATALQSELLKLTELAADISINGSRVERVHTASLQLLTALVRDLEKAGRQCQWLALSPVLEKSITDLGLSEIMHLPTQIHNESEIEKEQV